MINLIPKNVLTYKLAFENNSPFPRSSYQCIGYLSLSLQTEIPDNNPPVHSAAGEHPRLERTPLHLHHLVTVPQ